MPRGKKLAGGDGAPEWELLPDDVFVPRRGRGRLDLAEAMGRRFGARKRHRPARDVFVPRRAPRTGPPADPSILVVSSRIHKPRSEPTDAVQQTPATWDGVWDSTSAAAAVRDHDTGVTDPTEVFAAHLASGWTLRPRSGVDGNESSPFPTSLTLDLRAPSLGARAEEARDDATDEKETRFGFEAAEQKKSAVARDTEAFGLVPMAPRDPRDAETTRPIARAIARLCGGVSAARLGGVTCRDRRWCRVGLREAEAALARVKRVAARVKKNAVSRESHHLSRRAAAAAADLAAGVTLSLREAARALREDASQSQGNAPDEWNDSGLHLDDAFARAAAAMEGSLSVSGPNGATRPGEGKRAASGNAPVLRGDETRVTHRCAIALAAALDEAWFQVAYHARACGWCDPSDAYGTGKKGDASAAYLAAAENAWRPSSKERRALVEKARRDPNPFASVLHSRLREGARLFARAREEENDPLRSGDAGASFPAEGVGERAVVAAAEAEKKTRVFFSRRVGRTKSKRTPRERDRTSERSTLPAPACPPLTRAWRDACRSWPCRLYAFAAPTDAALRALKKSATRWLEIGAGAGYWAAQMRRMGMDVVALDADPPGEGTHNAYHGSCAPWHPVERGDAAAASAAGEKATPERTVTVSRLAGRAVFMCYPPPGFDSRMASETLEAYVAERDATSQRGGEAARDSREGSREDSRGSGDSDHRVLALVGEWDGNTADGVFARSLTRHFTLARRVALPQWGDTAHELTVWRRKRTRFERAAAAQVVDATLPLKSCAWCGGGRVEGDDEAEKTTARGGFLRRCVLCRDDGGTFCSASCARLGAAKHAETHALRLIPTPDSRLVDWSDRGDYVAFRPFARRGSS